ncbi:MAG: hypothetical protein Q8N51_13715 [Gammaproteobacteria bacterium]|nr:hypothetical protein [Gammaproteobacteria bacterium]
MREMNLAWLRCEVLANGVGHRLIHCFNSIEILNALTFIPEIEAAVEAYRAADEKFMSRPKAKPKVKRLPPTS